MQPLRFIILFVGNNSLANIFLSLTFNNQQLGNYFSFINYSKDRLILFTNKRANQNIYLTQQQSTISYMFGKISFSAIGSSDDSKTKNIFNKQSSKEYKQYNTPQQTSLPTHKKKLIKKDKNKQDLIKNIGDLQGAKFRILNQMLYTRESNDALSYFKNNQQDFQLYHQGFRHQTTKWKYRPIDQIIQFILKNKEAFSKKKIVDLGCGDGFLYQQLINQGFNQKKIKSYDLVSPKPFIKVADIANLPLKSDSVDLCIFCLSLMGTNYISFIRQAWRILKNEGELFISQVQSRSPNWKKFIQMVQLCGFTLINNGLHLLPSFHQERQESRFFRTMRFKKIQINSNMKPTLKYEGKNYDLQTFSKLILGSCLYKKR